MTIGDKIAFALTAFGVILSAYTLGSFLPKQTGRKKYKALFSKLVIFCLFLAALFIGTFVLTYILIYNNQISNKDNLTLIVMVCFYYYENVYFHDPNLYIYRTFWALRCLGEDVLQLFIILISCEVAELISVLDNRITPYRLKRWKWFCVGLFFVLTSIPNINRFVLTATGKYFADNNISFYFIIPWGVFCYLFDNLLYFYVGYLFFNFNKKNKQENVKRKYRICMMITCGILALDFLQLVFYIVEWFRFYPWIPIALVLPATQHTISTIHCNLIVYSFYHLKELLFYGKSDVVAFDESDSQSPSMPLEPNKPIKLLSLGYSYKRDQSNPNESPTILVPRLDKDSPKATDALLKSPNVKAQTYNTMKPPSSRNILDSFFGGSSKNTVEKSNRINGDVGSRMNSMVAPSLGFNSNQSSLVIQNSPQIPRFSDFASPDAPQTNRLSPIPSLKSPAHPETRHSPDSSLVGNFPKVEPSFKSPAQQINRLSPESSPVGNFPANRLSINHSLKSTALRADSSNIGQSPLARFSESPALQPIRHSPDPSLVGNSSLHDSTKEDNTSTK